MQACFIPIYAFCISAESLGSFDFIQTVAGIVSPIAFCAIWEAVLRFCLDTDANDIDRSTATIVKFCLFVVVFSIVISIISVGLLPAELYNQTIFVLLITVVQGSAQVWQYLTRAHGESQLYVESGVVGAFSYLFATVVLNVILSLQLVGLISSYCIGQFCILLFLEKKMGYIKQSISYRFDRMILLRYVSYSAPLIFNLASMLIMTGFGRILVASMLGPAENGLYVFAMKFSSVISAVGGVVSMATIEETILRMHDDNLGVYYSNVISSLWVALLSAASIALPCIGLFYHFISDTEFFGSFYLVPPFILYAVFNVMSTNYGNAYQVALRMPEIAFTSIIGMVVTVLLSVSTIYSLSTYGVALALCLGMFATMVLRCIASRSMIRYRVNSRKIVYYIGSYIIVASAAVVFQSNLLALIIITILQSIIFMPKLLSSINSIRSISD